MSSQLRDPSRFLAQMLHELPRRRRQILQGPDAQSEIARSPGILQFDGNDRRGSGGAAGGGLGHDAEAHAGLHHAADRIEAAQLHPQADGPADA